MRADSLRIAASLITAIALGLGATTEEAAASVQAPGVISESFTPSDPGVALIGVFEGEGSLDASLDFDFEVAGSVPAGMPVRSYYFEVLPLPSQALETYTLTITFDQPILGVVGLRSTLEAANSALDADSDFDRAPFTPTSGGDIGQLNPTADPPDVLAISGRTLTLNGAVSTGNDAFRVLVAATPEPGSFLCWAGMIGLAAGYRRKNG